MVSLPLGMHGVRPAVKLTFEQRLAYRELAAAV